MKSPSFGKITNADPQKQKVIVQLEPFGFETGWLPCLFGVGQDMAGSDCVVIPCHGTYGQAIVLPYPLALPDVGVLSGMSPPRVTLAGSTVDCMTTVTLTGDDVGRQVLVVPTPAGPVIGGVML